MLRNLVRKCNVISGGRNNTALGNYCITHCNIDNAINNTSSITTSSIPSPTLSSAYSLSTPFYSQSRGYAAGNVPELTKDRYGVKRGNYNTLTESHIKFFTELLGEHRVLTDPSEIEGYNVDWIKSCRGYSSLVLKPRSTEEVSKILAYCNNELLAVCPQGGNTGLVGGSVPVHDEIIISSALMNQIISFDENSGVIVCQAGCILEKLDEYLGERGYIMPLDLGAKGSCHIGGNVSTNAGGLRLLRYGNLHGSVLGIEAVLANGTIIDCLSTLKKDNTGYHLKHLFIGSEGTLGFVTKVAINCPTKPKAISVAFLGLKSFDDVLKTFHKAKRDLGEILSSCEMIDFPTLEMVTENLNLRSPLADFPFYMLIESAGSNKDHDEQKLNEFLEHVMGDGIVVDGTVTNEPSKINDIWQLRERVAEAYQRSGYCFKYDVSLPLKEFYTIVPILTERLGQSVHRVSGYGHLGDGNLHLNIGVKEFSHEVENQLEPYVFEFVSKLKGSVSAEHGIGFKKVKFMSYSKSENAIALMHQLKEMFDPNKILSPHKVLKP